ncbi:MAG: cell wall hydrolase [Pelomonas sp.]|nr:cell wall hydrolase [Roseateles sp.]
MSGAIEQARVAFRALGAPLREGRAGCGTEEWLRPETIDGLSFDLGSGAPRVLVHVSAGWPLHLVPRWLSTPCGRMELVPRRVPRPQLHCAAITLDAARGLRVVKGTAGFLANDAFSPGVGYLITAGHVLGADIEAGFDDPVKIEALVSGVQIERALLAETSTPLGGVVPGSRAGPFPVDAGLIRLRPDDWRDLIDKVPAILPADIASPPKADAPLRVLLPDGSTLSGKAMREEAQVNFDVEQILPDGTVAMVTLRIDALCSSQLDGQSIPGFSGAPVRDGNDNLIGIHCAYREGDSGAIGNALYTPVGPILDHFSIVALTQTSRRAPLPTRVRPALRDAVPRSAIAVAGDVAMPRRPTNEEVIDTLARTLWAEARGEGEKGMEAVACVVLNRAAAPRWWGRNIVEVCRKPAQFSCWNEGTSSLGALRRVTTADPDFVRALAISRRAVAGDLADFTNGALYYHTIEVLPKWVNGCPPCFNLGRHIFYNDIERRAV